MGGGRESLHKNIPYHTARYASSLRPLRDGRAGRTNSEIRDITTPLTMSTNQNGSGPAERSSNPAEPPYNVLALTDKMGMPHDHALSVFDPPTTLSTAEKETVPHVERCPKIQVSDTRGARGETLRQ